MTRRSLLSLSGGAWLWGQQQVNLAPLLDRLSEEAEIFFRSITRVVGTETLRQKAQKPERRFRPRLGSAPPETPQWTNKEVISEFGVSSFEESGGLLHEVRKVQQVDGRQVLRAGEARMSLALDMRSREDSVRRKLLLDLKQHGLSDVATDFTLSMLIFRKQAVRGLVFGPARQARLGADDVLAVRFAQRDGEGEFTVFNGNQTFKQKLQGEVWLRLPDGVPLRVVLVAASPGDRGVTILDEGQTDYFPSAQGYLLPASVVHRRYYNKQMFVEGVFTYQRFQRFTADAEIRFEEVETAPARP